MWNINEDTTALGHILPPRGAQFEEIADGFITQRLLRDFIYLRPRVSLSRGYRELSDLLIVLEGNCIPIQLKVEGRDQTRSGDELASWVLKEAVAAGRQVSGAIRTIGGLKITVCHPTQGDVHFPPGTLTPTHGLAVMEYLGSPLTMPSYARHTSPSGVPIHYFTLNDLFNIVELSGSLPDFLKYLDQRRHLSIQIRSLLGAERDLYGCFLLDGILRPDLTVEEVAGRWASVMSQERGEFQRRQAHHVFVRFFDGVIDDLHKRDPELETYVPVELQWAIEPHERRRGYLRMASVLNRLPYSHRREIGKRVFDMAKRADLYGGELYFYTLGPDDRWVLVFMVSGNENRTERIKSLYALALTVLYKVGRKNAVAVAYPPLNSPLGLETLLMEDFDTAGLDLDDLVKGMPFPKPIPITMFAQPSDDARLPKDEDFTGPGI